MATFRRQTLLDRYLIHLSLFFKLKYTKVELGYALMPKFWGKGLAVEIGKKTLTIAFNCFNYKNVVCYTLVDNKKSQRVMQKIGFTFEENIFHANLPHVLYRYQNPNYQLRKH